MAASKNKLKFPVWYTPVKWGVPIILGLASALIIGSIITGTFPLVMTPVALKWLATSYAALEGFGAAAMLTLAMSMVALLVGALTQGFLRATILFDLNEKLATKLIEKNEEAEKKTEGFDPHANRSKIPVINSKITSNKKKDRNLDSGYESSEESENENLKFYIKR